MILNENIELKKYEYKNKTYRVKNNKIEGFIDNRDSLIQHIDKIFKTDKYAYDIYDEYGLLLSDLIGEERAYVRAELISRIEEELLEDDRITEVSDFHFDFKGDMLNLKFKISSVYGDIEIERRI